METLGDRLKYILDLKHISNYKIAMDLDIGKSTIANYINNATKPDKTKLDSICQYLTINKIWILTGEGDIFQEKKEEARESIEKKEILDTNKLLEAIERRDKQLDRLIEHLEKRIIEKDVTISVLSDKIKSLESSEKKTIVPLDGGAMNADAEGFSDK